MAGQWTVLLAGCLLAAVMASSAGAPVSDEDEATNEVLPLEILLKRATNLGGRMCRLDSRNCGAFNMGKKFGGYSWLRSADSTMRRLQYYFGNKWPQQQGGDEDSQQVPALQKEVYWENN